VAAGYLRKTALQEYKRLRERRGDDVYWEEFKQLLLNRFEYVESTDSVVTRLCKIKQEDSLEDYINKFTYTLSRGEVADEVAVGLFTNGLSADLATEVQYRRPPSLNEAIHMVMDFARIKMGMKFGHSSALKRPSTMQVRETMDVSSVALLDTLLEIAARKAIGRTPISVQRLSTDRSIVQRKHRPGRTHSSYGKSMRS
jgi:hypothetical protein